MDKIVRQIPKTKLIPDGFIDEPVFITVDGKEFKTEKDAKDYENVLIVKENFIKKYNLRTIELNGGTYDVIYIKNINNDVEKEICNFGYKWSDLKGWLYAGWNLIETDDSGDCTCVTCHRLSSMIVSAEEELRQLKELNVSEIL